VRHQPPQRRSRVPLEQLFRVRAQRLRRPRHAEHERLGHQLLAEPEVEGLGRPVGEAREQLGGGLRAHDAQTAVLLRQHLGQLRELHAQRLARVQPQALHAVQRRRQRVHQAAHGAHLQRHTAATAAAAAAANTKRREHAPKDNFTRERNISKNTCREEGIPSCSCMG
jgi:hypothetical protein